MNMRNAIRRYFDDVWNAGKLELLAELIHPAYVNRAPGLPDMPPGPAGLEPIVVAMRSAFPDLRYQILHEVYQGDLACVRTLVSGTQTGAIWGQPPTHRAFAVEQMQIERFADGKIVEHWRVTDEAGLARQLGWS